MNKIKKYNPLFIKPSIDSVLGRLGYNKNKSILDENIINNIINYIEESGNFIKPKGHSLDIKIKSILNGIIILENDLKINSKKLQDLLKNSSFISIIICTIGDKITNEIQNLTSNNNYSKAVILDAIASETVEEFANFINEILIQEKKLLGFKPTMRFSPGYGDLDISIHKHILPLLKSEEIGISYNSENYILYPEKSISAIIGWEKY